MEKLQFDVVVIGSGPGGEGAAMQAVKHGKRVAMVEQFDRIGGGCTHWATIPSKALRYAIFQMTEANRNPLFREAGVSLHLSIPDLRRSARSVIEQQVEMRSSFYERNRVPVFVGRGRFVDPHTLEVCEDHTRGAATLGQRVRHRHRLAPYRPADVDFGHPRIFDSDTILDLGYTPQSITIYGAGVVGCEYTSMFRNLAIKVNLINTRAKLLEFLDDEIIDALAYHMRDLGVLVRHDEQYERVEPRDDGVVCTSKAASSSRPTSCCGPTAARARPRTWASSSSAFSPTSAGSWW